MGCGLVYERRRGSALRAWQTFRGRGGVKDAPVAACVGTDLNLWFAKPGHTPKQKQEYVSTVMQAITICSKCERQVQCLEYAMTAGITGGPVEYGVWGGFDFTSRTRSTINARNRANRVDGAA
jgi:hypothetical protein